jgi:hypothetical protein
MEIRFKMTCCVGQTEFMHQRDKGEESWNPNITRKWQKTLDKKDLWNMLTGIVTTTKWRWISARTTLRVIIVNGQKPLVI